TGFVTLSRLPKNGLKKESRENYPPHLQGYLWDEFQRQRRAFIPAWGSAPGNGDTQQPEKG
ncbi:MAG TPA: hypothetical protein VNZ22_17585, partial [Bacillota bacterium]|nr:hypothetical protein [Bacillota bacterium]